jgi:hypothetical protein
MVRDAMAMFDDVDADAVEVDVVPHIGGDFNEDDGMDRVTPQ